MKDSFGRRLSDEFRRTTSQFKACLNEVTLICLLNKSFEHVAVGDHYKVDTIHGQKSFIEFDYRGSAISNVDDPRMKIELADMLFLVYSRAKGQVNVAYMQNKVYNGKQKYKDRFRADLKQLYFLQERCGIVSEKLPECVFGDRNILKESPDPSITLYGVYYKEPDKYEMAYYSAEHIKPITESGKSYRRVVQLIPGYTLERLSNNRLEDFGNSLYRMELGRRIRKNGTRHEAEVYDQVMGFIEVSKSKIGNFTDNTSIYDSNLGVASAVIIDKDNSDPE